MKTPRVLILILALLVGLPTLASAQETVTASLKRVHNTTSRNLTQTAEMLDDEMYAYQPTAEVRTAGQILAHVADSQYYFCAAAAGEENPNQENFEESATTKADIVAALNDAIEYCNGVYDTMTDEDGAKMRPGFGDPIAASAILAFNSSHNFEHYGNLVTYMRINGIVPPSSQ